MGAALCEGALPYAGVRDAVSSIIAAEGWRGLTKKGGTLAKG
eukprot:gene4743-12218_t